MPGDNVADGRGITDFQFPVLPVYATKTELSDQYRCLPLLDVSVAVQIQSTVARSTLSQRFHNPSGRAIEEAIYSFPLYDGAAVISFRCHLGEDRVLEGRVKPKAEAKAVYQKALAEQQSAALLHEHTPEVFEARLGNVPSKATVQIELVYVSELKADLGGLGISLTIPTSVAPRYGTAPAEYSSSTVDKSHTGLNITVDVMSTVPIRRLESSTHPISVEIGTCGTGTTETFADLASPPDTEDHDPRKARAALTDRSVTLGKDFVLLIVAPGILQSQAVLEPGPSTVHQGAIMVSLNPRDLLEPQIEMDQFEGEIIFLADRSGSMQGQRINMLSDALKIFFKSLPVSCRLQLGFIWGYSTISLAHLTKVLSALS